MRCTYCDYEADITDSKCPKCGSKGWLIRQEYKEQESWVGVDLDKTLAVYKEGYGLTPIGEAIPKALRLVKELLKVGFRVKIVTARVADGEYPALIASQRELIQKWLKKNGLPALEITGSKDFKMSFLIDDRAIRVEANTGEMCEGCKEAFNGLSGLSGGTRVRDRRSD
ncbi:MAG: hypothetical protein A2139_02910 [Desulfobacca sp. RBG_16_60_12]|nr:MAG: hypothetical protein A2139_02910 [Desulfobacca sp. RBG_16_60_12]